MADTIDPGSADASANAHGSTAEPERTLLTARSEYHAAAERIFSLTQRELCIFDPDLQEFRLDTPARIESLRSFLLRSVDSRLYVAVRDPEFVRLYCPRLITLLAGFSTSMFIWRAEGEAARVQDCFVLADRTHVVRRPVALQPRGVLILNDQREGLVMHERFQEIWDTSVPSVSASTSGQ
ncbi:MAG: hypothetical protein FJY55_03690 [Betaproteobacteria bacterium]|nr:hypothetical protein [Betaproteobacteria bacterium]